MNSLRGLSALTLAVTAAACGMGFDDTSMRFHPDGDQIVAVGDIDGQTIGRFEDISAAYPTVRRLVLQYVGGSVDDEANLAFAREVRRLGFTTVVPEDGLIASSGTDLFLAGVSRIVAPAACVSVHAWATESYTATDISRTSSEHVPYLAYYKDIGIDPDFYWFTIDAARALDMHWMSASEVAHYDVSTSPVGSLSPAEICDAR